MSNRQSRDAAELQRGPLTAAASPCSARRYIAHRKKKENGRDDDAADGLVAAPSAAAEKELAPVALRPGIVHRLEAVAFLRKTAAAAAAAATAKPAHEAASRIACS